MKRGAFAALSAVAMAVGWLAAQEPPAGMALIPAGEFTMGSPGSEPLRGLETQHRVTIPSFALGKYEVTFAQWDACIADGGCGVETCIDLQVAIRGWGLGVGGAGRCQSKRRGKGQERQASHRGTSQMVVRPQSTTARGQVRRRVCHWLALAGRLSSSSPEAGSRLRKKRP